MKNLLTFSTGGHFPNQNLNYKQVNKTAMKNTNKTLSKTRNLTVSFFTKTKTGFIVDLIKELNEVF